MRDMRKMWNKKQEKVQKAYSFPSLGEAEKYLEDLRKERDKINNMVSAGNSYDCCCSPFNFHSMNKKVDKKIIKKRFEITEEILNVLFIIRNSDFGTPSTYGLENHIETLIKSRDECKRHYDSNRRASCIIDLYNEEIQKCQKMLLVSKSRDAKLS